MTRRYTRTATGREVVLRRATLRGRYDASQGHLRLARKGPVTRPTVSIRGRLGTGQGPKRFLRAVRDGLSVKGHIVSGHARDRLPIPDLAASPTCPREGRRCPSRRSKRHVSQVHGRHVHTSTWGRGI